MPFENTHEQPTRKKATSKLPVPVSDTCDLRINEFPEEVAKLCRRSLSVLFTGSRYCCEPPVTDTDADIMLYVLDMWRFVKEYMRSSDFVLCGNVDEQYDDSDLMVAFRYKEFNILITDDSAYFHKWLVATDVAKKLNVQSKADRKYLFDRITTL
jgi:hypothetical protein